MGCLYVIVSVLFARPFDNWTGPWDRLSSEKQHTSNLAREQLPSITNGTFFYSSCCDPISFAVESIGTESKKIQPTSVLPTSVCFVV